MIEGYNTTNISNKSGTYMNYLKLPFILKLLI